jgi:hypothetical protein
MYSVVFFYLMKIKLLQNLKRMLTEQIRITDNLVYTANRCSNVSISPMLLNILIRKEDHHYRQPEYQAHLLDSD